jgi:hypothetical protein
MDNATKWMLEHRIQSNFEVIVFYKGKIAGFPVYDGPDNDKAMTAFNSAKIDENVEMIFYRINGEIQPKLSFIATEDRE